SNAPLSSRKFRRRKYEATSFHCFFLISNWCRPQNSDSQRPPPTAFTPRGCTCRSHPSTCAHACVRRPPRCRRLATLGPTRMSFLFSFSLCFFLTHFEWAGRPSTLAPSPRPSTPPHPHPLPLDPDPATSTWPRHPLTPPTRLSLPRPRHAATSTRLHGFLNSTPLHRPRLDTTPTTTLTPAPPLPPTPFTQAPPRTGAISTRPHCHLDACTVAAHPFAPTSNPPRPHPTPPTPFRHGLHRHLDAGTIATHSTPTPTPPRPHHRRRFDTAAATTRLNPSHRHGRH
ncbi:hypothetical protein EDB84DRAFT_871131, partial [Lactarius hengduanensis]